MTREEAVRELEFLASCSYVDRFEPTEKEALKMAIEALKQEPYGNAISREEVLRMLRACLTGGEIEYQYVKLHIDSIPSVKPQEKIGHWIKLFLTDTSDIDGQCSECGFIHKFINGHTAQYNYCPSCGAHMKGGE